MRALSQLGPVPKESPIYMGYLHISLMGEIRKGKYQVSTRKKGRYRKSKMPYLDLNPSHELLDTVVSLFVVIPRPQHTPFRASRRTRPAAAHHHWPVLRLCVRLVKIRMAASLQPFQKIRPNRAPLPWQSAWSRASER